MERPKLLFVDSDEDQVVAWVPELRFLGFDVTSRPGLIRSELDAFLDYPFMLVHAGSYDPSESGSEGDNRGIVSIGHPSELLRDLKERDYHGKLVLISAHSGYEIPEADKGWATYLRKPFSPEVLEGILKGEERK
jgi:hypothetical protein